MGPDASVWPGAVLRGDVAAGAVVPEGADVPSESFVRGVPATVTPLSETTLDPDEIFERYRSGAYTDLAGRHEALFSRDE